MYQPEINPQRWWFHHRIKFNKGLLIGGMVAFVLYTLCSGQIFTVSNGEVVSLVMLYEFIAYLVYMVLANIAYTAGWLADVLFNRSNSNAFRNILFACGYWFASCLPPVLVSIFFLIV